ncbi:hypothetical protein GF318_04550 [Candidatus Micrarchaeota archaeon]|nr:hypothetical protein [Candidatus Micrarchaeota archaeon]
MIVMMKNAAILSIVFALLLFGCAAPEQQGEGPAAGEEQAGEAEDNATGPSETGDGVSDSDTGDEDGAGQEPDSGVDLTGLDYAAVMALGIPVQCDITTTQDGETTDVKLYANGENEIRWESEMEGMEECGKFVYILKNNKVYFGCEGSKFPPGSTCDWLTMESEAGDGGEPSGDMGGMTVDTPEFEDVPSTQISCLPWIYDSSMFATPGKVCTMEDYMQEAMDGYEY